MVNNMVLEMRGNAVALYFLLGRIRVVVELGPFVVFHDDSNRSNNYIFGWKRWLGAKTNRGGWEADVVALSRHVWI
jgi:hypothetical protein